MSSDKIRIMSNHGISTIEIRTAMDKALTRSLNRSIETGDVLLPDKVALKIINLRDTSPNPNIQSAARWFAQDNFGIDNTTEDVESVVACRIPAMQQQQKGGKRTK